MKPTSLTAPLLALTFAALLGLARPGAAAAAPDVLLYDGKTAAEDKISVGDWGGGTVQESTELFLFGGHSLKVTTLDPYQGAQISFATPVPLAAGQAFQVTFQHGGATLHYDPRAIPGASAPDGTAPAAAPPYAGGFRGRGGRGGRGGRFGGRFGGRGGYPARETAPLIPPITKLHLRFMLADGRQADALLPIPDTADAAAGQAWRSVSVPVSSLKFGGSASGALKSVMIAGDEYGVLFVGSIQLTSKPGVPEAVVPAEAAPEEATPEEGTMPEAVMGIPGQ